MKNKIFLMCLINVLPGFGMVLDEFPSNYTISAADIKKWDLSAQEALKEYEEKQKNENSKNEAVSPHKINEIVDALVELNIMKARKKLLLLHNSQKVVEDAAGNHIISVPLESLSD